MKFDNSRRRKCHISTKCQNFLRRHIFSAKHVLYASTVFRVYEQCVHTFLGPTQKICKKSRNVCTRLSARKKLSVFVYTAFFRGAQQMKFGNSQQRKYRILTKCPHFSGECLIRIFFLQNTFCANVLFSGCASNVIYLFFT